MTLRRQQIVPALIAAAVLGWILPAEARNPHCAGGIQYVVGGLRDKEKGNLEDYQRQFNKAVAQLEQCAAEDPEDVEAMGYLGWAYAEVDSAAKAGVAFAAAIEGLKLKGDAKKVEWATNNRDSYWANAFNDGIGKIGSAQAAYPDYTQKPENESDQTLRGEAGQRYQEAIASLTRASLLRPNHPATIRSLGSVYVFMGDYRKAAEIYRSGLAVAPGDSALTASLKLARTNHAAQLLEQKKYDEAIGFFQDLLNADGENGELYSGLADARFQKAQKAEGDEKKPAFKAAADAYAKAFSLRTDNADLAFNAALAYQNAGEHLLAEAQWRNALKAKPGDVETISSLAGTLAENKKFGEAQDLLIDGLAIDPRSKTLHRQLGGVYTKAGHNSKANEELMVFLAMQNGQKIPDLSNYFMLQPRPGTAMAGKLKSLGPPDDVYLWSEVSGSAAAIIKTTKLPSPSGSTKDLVEVTLVPTDDVYEAWFYWAKRLALHFKGGVLLVTTDWNKGPSSTSSIK